MLVFGESKNDVDSIRELLIHVQPALDGRVLPRLRPASLQRDAGVGAVRDWVSALGDVVQATRRGGKDVAAVLVHRDADGPDATAAVESKMNSDLRSVPASAVVPVQMLEAWWLLHPDSVESIRPAAWRGRIPRRAGDVEVIEQPKLVLQRATRRSNEYAEADSPMIAAKIRARGDKPLGTSASFDRFCALAREIS